MKWKVAGVLVVIIVIALSVYVWRAPGKYDDVADCLTEKGVLFYGTYWCPYCKAQKAMFGKSMKNIVYVECASPVNPQQQTQECKDANIQSYPTWVFPDGSRLSGKVEPEKLALKAGCPV